MNKTLEVIKQRRSIRAYQPEQIKQEVLESIVEAGLYAPNGGGEAWHFTVIQNQELIERLNRLAKEAATKSGLPWLEQLGNDEAFHCLYQAPAVILVSADESGPCAESDTAAATQNILLAAESLGLGSCWGYFATQAFFSSEGAALRKELAIPDGYKVYTSIMLGYPSGEKPEAKPRREGTVTFF